jgi:hypothetical protein
MLSEGGDDVAGSDDLDGALDLRVSAGMGEDGAVGTGPVRLVDLYRVSTAHGLRIMYWAAAGPFGARNVRSRARNNSSSGVRLTSGRTENRPERTNRPSATSACRWGWP